jgi:hypothetical protein
MQWNQNPVPQKHQQKAQEVRPDADYKQQQSEDGDLKLFGHGQFPRLTAESRS